MERKTLESEASHENSKFWTEPKHAAQANHEVPVIYYLSRNGQLEHPHLMYVSISSLHGIPRLKDVISRLSFLRGIARMYSRSIKRKTLESEASHENSKHTQADHEVPVIYYLSRNGQLEHPHLMYVSISSSHGTPRLKDVISRLSFLRGQGIARMYSWSVKRSYKNGFVWQDLSENDFIYPNSSHEYVLKGTQLIELSSYTSNETIISMPSSKSSNERNSYSMDAADSPSSTMKDSQRDCKLYKAKICREFAEKSSNTWTQTEEMTSRNRMESEGYCLESEDIRNQKIENERPSGRMRATQVLMQLVSCTSIGEEL